MPSEVQSYSNRHLVGRDSALPRLIDEKFNRRIEVKAGDVTRFIVRWVGPIKAYIGKTRFAQQRRITSK